MRIARYRQGDGAAHAVIMDDIVFRLDGDPYGEFRPGSRVASLSEVELLAPCEPTKVIGVGRNYASLVREQGRQRPREPFIFLKGPNTVVGSDAAVLRPAGIEQFEFEGELAVVIGRTANRLTRDNYRQHILGYTCSNDLTVRDWQTDSVQWVYAKGSDTLCPIGPWIETELPDPESVRLRTLVNGEVCQDGHTSDFIFGIAEQLEHITRTITLEPGDVILTGTPGGFRPVANGDVIEVEIEGIGTLRNPVRQVQ